MRNIFVSGNYKKDMTINKDKNLAFNFLVTGFRDYKASRFLLNNNFYMQGVTLASSSVEKYLKAILIINNLKRAIHLDKLKEIKKAFQIINNPILDELDENFLKVLGDAYALRYYDKVQGSISFGFFVNQLLAELDFTINLIDQRLSGKSEITGEIVLSPYQIAVNNQDEIIYQNNYILNNIDKKDFMERVSKNYNLHIENNGHEHEIIGDGLRVEEYKGKMIRLLDIKF